MVNNNTLINVQKLISSCKNGGILKYQSGNSILYRKNSSITGGVNLLYNPASQFVQQGLRGTHRMLTNKNQKRADAVTKKIREKKGYVASDENRRVADYQAKLASLGYLKYSDIDGYWGNKTQAAYQKFKSDQKKQSNQNSQKRIQTRQPDNKQTTSQSNYQFVQFKPTFPQFHFPIEDRLNEKVQVPYRSKYYTNPDMQVIQFHKVTKGVRDPYLVLDKQNHTLYQMQGNDTIRKWDVSLGQREGDAYNMWSDAKINGKNVYSMTPAMSGAGTYTVGRRTTETGYTESNKPNIIHLKNSKGQYVPMSIHAQVASRKGQWDSGKRRLSYGCIAPALGTFQKGLSPFINRGDTLYVLPEEAGNRYEENNGQLQMVFDKRNAPSTATQTDHGTWTHNTVRRYNGIIK